MATDLSKLAASLTDAITSVRVFDTDITDDEGCRIGGAVSRDDLMMFRDDLAEAVATALRAYLERNG